MQTKPLPLDPPNALAERTSASTTTSRENPTDLLFAIVPILLCCLFALLSIAHSLATPFWGDEIYSHYPIADPSLGHLLRISREPMNTAPPLYFVIGWFYAHLFGANELALRLLSCLFICGSVVVLWYALRRRGYHAGAVAYALAAVFTLCPEIVIQADEARFYAPYLFFACVVVYCYLQVADRTDGPWHRYLPLYIANTALIFTHSLGLLYTGCLILTQFLLDVARRKTTKPSLGVYVATIASWVTFFALWGAIAIAQQKAFAGATWVGRPNAGYIRLMFLPTKISAPLLLLPLVATAVASLKRRPESSPDPLRGKSPDAALLTGIVFLLIPTGLVCLASFVTTSFFVTRYLLPLWVGWAILLAWSLDYAVRREGRIARFLPVAVALVLVVGGGYTLRGAKEDLRAMFNRSNAPFSAESNTIDAELSDHPEGRDLPIIQTRVGYFLPEFYYDRDRSSRDIFVEDPEFARQASGSGEMLASYVNLTAMEPAYIPGHVMMLDEFLAHHDRFLLLDINDDWVRFRFADPARFIVTPLAPLQIPRPRSGHETVPATLYLIRTTGKSSQ